MADDADYTAISKTADLQDWADEHVAVLRAGGAWNRAKVSTGSEPDDHLQGVELGDAAAHNDVRLFYDGTNVLVQENTGSEGSPSWTTRFTIAASSGAVTHAGVLTLGDDLDCDGNEITNAGDINGVTITSLASRLQPGGADALTVAAPTDVGSSNAAGSSSALARADHVHEGVHSVAKAGDSEIHGDATLTGGDRISLTQAGSDIEIDWDVPGDTYDDTSAQSDDASFTTGAGETAISWDASDTADGHLFPGADGAKDYDVWAQLLVGKGGSNGDDTIRLRVGTAGTTSDALERVFVHRVMSGAEEVIHLYARIEGPADDDMLTVTYDADGATATVRGGSTTTGQFSTLLIREVAA